MRCNARVVFALVLLRNESSLRMGNDAPVIVYFSCPKCPAVYQATQAPRAEKGHNRFSCKNCGTPVQEWTGLYDFFDWRHVMKAPPDAESFW